MILNPFIIPSPTHLSSRFVYSMNQVNSLAAMAAGVPQAVSIGSPPGGMDPWDTFGFGPDMGPGGADEDAMLAC